MASSNNWVYHRRADLESASESTALSLEWGKIEVITNSGECLALAFVPCNQHLKLSLDAANLMEYLATLPITLPTAGEQLRFCYHVFTSCERDSLNEKLTTVFSDFEVTFRLTDQTSGQSYVIKKPYSDANGAIDDEQLVMAAVTLAAGASIMVKPELGGPSVAGREFNYSLGHIYLETAKALPKPMAWPLRVLEPETFGLFQNYPNPFNTDTEIRYQLPQVAHITLRIVNLMGQEVRTLVDREQSPGVHAVRWDGKDAKGQDLASGIYIYRFEAGSFVASKKLVLIR